MTSVLLKHIFEQLLPRCNVDPNLKSVLCFRQSLKYFCTYICNTQIWCKFLAVQRISSFASYNHALFHIKISVAADSLTVVGCCQNPRVTALFTYNTNLNSILTNEEPTHQPGHPAPIFINRTKKLLSALLFLSLIHASIEFFKYDRIHLACTCSSWLNNLSSSTIRLTMGKETFLLWSER